MIYHLLKFYRSKHKKRLTKVVLYKMIKKNKENQLKKIKTDSILKNNYLMENWHKAFLKHMKMITTMKKMKIWMILKMKKVMLYQWKTSIKLLVAFLNITRSKTILVIKMRQMHHCKEHLEEIIIMLLIQISNLSKESSLIILK